MEETIKTKKHCINNGRECNLHFMSETNFDWDDVRLFLAVARNGGLAGAAESTGKSAPTLGRRMLALELQVGRELFTRHARGYGLTEHGESFLATAETIENGINSIAAQTGVTTTRRVKISAGSWVTYLLSQHVSNLSGDAAVILQFISAEHVLDIAHREAVIGIRNQRPSQISLAGQQIGKIQFAVYAENSQVNTWASVLGSTPSAKWVREQITNTAFVEVTNPRSALDMALAGSVKVVLPTFIGDKTAGLHRLSDEIDELEHMQWLVSHHEDRHLVEVRQVLDRVYDVLMAN